LSGQGRARKESGKEVTKNARTGGRAWGIQIRVTSQVGKKKNHRGEKGGHNDHTIRSNKNVKEKRQLGRASAHKKNRLTGKMKKPRTGEKGLIKVQPLIRKRTAEPITQTERVLSKASLRRGTG